MWSSGETGLRKMSSIVFECLRRLLCFFFAFSKPWFPTWARTGTHRQLTRYRESLFPGLSSCAHVFPQGFSAMFSLYLGLFLTSCSCCCCFSDDQSEKERIANIFQVYIEKSLAMQSHFHAFFIRHFSKASSMEWKFLNF